MKTLINITTPAGKSLEGFPKTLNTIDCDGVITLQDGSINVFHYDSHLQGTLNMHKGDKIIIEVLED